MDYSSYGLNFDLGKKNAAFITARKSMLKLQSLVAKCCLMRKTYLCEILYYFVLRTGKCTTFGPNVVHFPARNINLHNKNLQISQGYIFRILQHFATKLCNFTNFNMLFLAVVMDFVFPA